MMTPFNHWSILAIDDEEDVRDVIQLALEDAGYTVHTAPEGKSGLRICDEIRPQIVITDIRMPGMNGLEVLEAVKLRYPQIEVIVATAFGEMELAIRALQLDASDFINKPIHVAALHTALDRAKHRYTTRKELADYTALLEKESAETSRELIRTFQFQKNLIENSMDGILGCDAADRVVTFNRSLTEMLEYSKTEVIGKKALADFFAPRGAEALLDELMGEKYGGSGRLNVYETEILTKGGRPIPVQITATLLSEAGQRAGAVFFIRDLREIRHLEQEVADQARILHQDKMMSLGRLAASVVHEINNPLSGILNYLRLMGRMLGRTDLTPSLVEKFRAYLEIVERETGRCSQIISSLLSFSRKSSPAFAPVCIAELIDRCLLLSRHKLELANIELTHEVAPDVPQVLGDFNQLQQCIINLIFNAVDAMPTGGTLILSAGYDSTAQQVTLMVKDSGPGISPHDLPHVFEPFYTTKTEGQGVGLGLSTVFGIMERHQGSVRVESPPGEGAVFFLTLPCGTSLPANKPPAG